MYYMFLSLHLLVALLLGVIVLLQRSKGNGLAGAFGGVGAGEAMFGSHGVTTMLHKATIYLAIAFMFTSLSLVYLTTQRHGGADDGPVRRTGGAVLPVGSGDVAAPDAPVALPQEGAVDDAVPGAGRDDSIVPAAEGDASQAGDEPAGTAGSGEEEESEGGNGSSNGSNR